MRFDSFSSLYLAASSRLRDQIPLKQDSPAEFIWDDLPAHEHLEFTPCFENFQCARLRVPMDWIGGSEEAKAGKTVEVALVKVEAKVPVTDPRYAGPVLINPGGPGGSGVSFALTVAQNIQTVLSAGPDADDKDAKYFDVIGFDPRGVNNTRPAAICYPDHLAQGKAEFERRSYGLIDSTNVSFDILWAADSAMSESCSERLRENGIAKHMSTPPVARDIIEIVERHGEWREKEAKRLLSLRSASGISESQRKTILERTAYKPNAEPVQYWGFSYGTVLGATMAALFPDRMSRIILDGVADAHDFMKGGWLTNLRDTDRTATKMVEYCFQGGPKNCAIYENSIEEIEREVDKSLEYFRSYPIGVPDDSEHGPSVVTFDDLMQYLSATVIYKPLKTLPKLAQILYEIRHGNGTTLAQVKREKLPGQFGEPLSERCKKDGPYSPTCFPTGANIATASPAIGCSDAFPGRFGQSKEDYREYADILIEQSKWEGQRWASIQMPCTHWNSQTHWRYEGNFHNKTHHPILFVGNTIDPVTPLYNAFLMASGFEGAGVLHQDSEGHCTSASISLCSGRALRHYFQSGELPGKAGGLDGWDGVGAFCQPDRVPFDGYTPDSETRIPKGETDTALWEALVGLNRE